MSHRTPKSDPAPAPAEVNAPYQIWGKDQIDSGAIDQLTNACRLPVAVKGALMPDAHIGYGLPIGGVLATVGAVIPYAVGVDIGCRMKLTVFDANAVELERKSDRFEKVLMTQTRFGAGNEWDKHRDHDVMDRDWSFSPVTKDMKDKAACQLGTSGGGNHFVEFGTFQSLPGSGKLGELEEGKKYVAVMSHSGSRGPGARVCQYYSDLAKKLLPEGYEWAKFLAWLDLGKAEGQEYWQAMNLMGDFAKANHDVIHRQIIDAIGLPVALQVENHHNFAWKEEHEGVEMVVHRKGATPAGKGVLGVIPGSMADPAYVVRGKGNEDSLSSAAHGAGRRMSRSAAKQAYRWDHWRQEIKDRGVKLLSAGIDEVPGVYKNIDEVMERQADLVDKVGKFEPKIVRMAEGGPAED
jgi:tRNA-splicing ligase RtcB